MTADAAVQPLEGIKVVDSASLFAGPVIATMLGDYGAEVTKVEHPSGDNLRKMGWEKDGVSLWWAVIGRNKRSVTIKLSEQRGAEASLIRCQEGREIRLRPSGGMTWRPHYRDRPEERRLPCHEPSPNRARQLPPPPDRGVC